VLYNKKHGDVEPHQLFNTWCGNPSDLIIGRHIVSQINSDLLCTIATLGNRLKQNIQSVATEFGVISNVRGRGYLLAFDCATPEARNDLITAMYKQDVLINACGYKSIRLRPSFALTNHHIDEFISKLRTVLRQRSAFLPNGVILVP
jgi:4-aminobutyrate aminotransferase-like enzyme